MDKAVRRPIVSAILPVGPPHLRLAHPAAQEDGWRSPMADDGAPFLDWMRPRDERALGLRHGLSLRDGFSLARTDVRYQDDADYHFPCPGEYLKFHFKLGGESGICEYGGDLAPVEAGRISMLLQPPGSFKRERIKGGSHDRSVTLVCDRAFTASLTPASADMPQPVREFLQGPASTFTFASMAMPPQLKPIVEDILNPPLAGPLRDMVIEAKALELLSYTLHQILSVPSAADLVRQRDRQKIHDLCDLFDADPACDLSITELCRRVAWNETQMMQCFKTVTGTTISGYRHQVRMERARRQLRDTEASVTEIAMDAGYEHPSNFATAFKRTFGISPKDARGRCA